MRPDIRLTLFITVIFAFSIPALVRAGDNFSPGIELQLGRGAGRGFDRLEGSVGLALRVRDAITLRARWNNYGHGDQDPPYRSGTSFTGGAVIHPLSFTGRDVKAVFQPYGAVDFGVGWLYGGSSRTFFQINALGGGNFDIGEHWTLFIEGGLMRIDYRNNGKGFTPPRASAVDQAVFGVGLRYFL